MRFFHPVHHVAEKCNFCYHRIAKKMKPACVLACPVGARQIGKIKDPGDAVAKTIMTQRVSSTSRNMEPTPGLLPRAQRGGKIDDGPGRSLDGKGTLRLPNEYIYWSIQIVMYPFMTGLVAGAFVLSSLYHLFGIRQLKEIARFSLVFSFALLMAAPLPLLFHLLQPERNFYIFMTPHFTSAIAPSGSSSLSTGPSSPPSCGFSTANTWWRFPQS